MPLPDAIRRLTTPGQIPIESSDALAADVVAGLATPAAVRPIPELYTGATGYGALDTTPLALLTALGGATAGPLTPDYEILAFAGAWAILRYLWAFEDPDPTTGELRTHPVTGRVRHHRRQLFSEDFGIAVAAHALIERLWRGIGPFPLVDADMVLDALVAAGAVTHTGDKRPDYLGWLHDGRERTLIVVECKGSSGSRSASVDQLARGVEQALSVRANGIRTRHFVVGAVATKDDWRLIAHAVEVAPHRLLPRPAPRRLADVDSAFVRASNIRLLRLAGAHADAARLLRIDEIDEREPRPLDFDGTPFRGVTLPAPGRDSDARLTVGLTPSRLEAARQDKPPEPEPDVVARAHRFGHLDVFRGSDEPYPKIFMGRPWHHAGRARSPGELQQEIHEGERPAVSWVAPSENESAVETIEGLRVSVAATDQ